MKKTANLGFTLVELLVVIAILGVLSTIGLVAFSSAQIRGRDAERKSDLKQISSALEIFYNDYGYYPPSSNGKIMACPYTSSTSYTSCSWGSGQMKDSKTIYLKLVPSDPAKNLYYYYRTTSSNQAYQIYAQIENTQDTTACIGGNCGTHTDFPSGVNCGTNVSCNFAITSPNVTFSTN